MVYDEGVHRDVARFLGLHDGEADEGGWPSERPGIDWFAERAVGHGQSAVVGRRRRARSRTRVDIG